MSSLIITPDVHVHISRDYIDLFLFYFYFMYNLQTVFNFEIITNVHVNVILYRAIALPFFCFISISSVVYKQFSILKYIITNLCLLKYLLQLRIFL